jgi:hypothetical protein
VAERSRQKGLRNELRRIGFYITDWDRRGDGFTVEEFDELVERGLITVQGGGEEGSKLDDDRMNWLAKLLEEATRRTGARPREHDPVGAEVLFEDWTTIQRIALGRSGARLALCAWPGELKGQAEALYGEGQGRVDRLLEFLDDHGEWQATPRPHLAFPFAKVHEVLYLTPSIDVRSYLECWTKPDAFARIGALPPSQVRSELWPWLLEQGLTDEGPGNDGRFDAYVERVATRPQALLRPGVELRREWDWKEGEEVAREALIGELRESLRELLDALNEPVLPRRSEQL